MSANKRVNSFGEKQLSIVDRFGVYLSLVEIKKHLKKIKEPFTVLDLGCGYNAALLTQLLSPIAKGVGVDVKINEILKSNLKLKFFETDIEKYVQENKDETFDVIFLISVLEHLWNPNGILAYCYQTLKPGGVLMINVPTWRGKFWLELSAFKLGSSPAMEMEDHKMYYDLRDLWPLLVKAGFSPKNIMIKNHKFGLNLFAVVRR